MKLRASLDLSISCTLFILYYCKSGIANELQNREKAEVELAQLIYLEETSEKVRNRSAEVKSSVPEYYNEISKIEENPKIVEMKKSLESAVLRDAIYEDCLHMFNKKLELFIDNIRKRFDRFVTEQLGTIEIHLEKYSEVLDRIRNRLEKHLNEELEDCKRESISCKITGPYATYVDEKKKEIEFMEILVDGFVNNVVELYKQTMVSLYIKDEVLDPVNECLNV